MVVDKLFGCLHEPSMNTIIISFILLVVDYFFHFDNHVKRTLSSEAPNQRHQAGKQAQRAGAEES